MGIETSYGLVDAGRRGTLRILRLRRLERRQFASAGYEPGNANSSSSASAAASAFDGLGPARRVYDRLGAEFRSDVRRRHG